jgi:hypothetical protein
MEFHKLLENEKFKAAIGPEKLALYLGEGGEELFEQDYSDALEDADNLVLEILFSAGDEDGCLDIHNWGGFYISQYYATGEDIRTESLEEHIKEFLGVGDAFEWRPEYTELKSTKLSLDELKALGLIFLSVESSTAEDGWCALPHTGQQFSSQITINGKTYERHNGELVEVNA